MLRRIFFALAIAALFTCVLNMQSLHAAVNGTLSVAYLNDHSVDERFYFSTISKVGNGAPPLGHSSYFEHRNDVSTVSLAPVIEGLVMRGLHLNLTWTLFLCDLLFPFLALFLLTLGLLKAFHKSFIFAGSAALIIGCEIGTYWFRASNPQLPLIATFAWLGVALSMPIDSVLALMLRAAILGSLTWLHVVYASFFLVLDGTLLLSRLLGHRSWKRTLRDGLIYGATLAIFVLPRLLVHLPPDVAQDTLYRLGIIRTHLPAAPQLQVLIVVFIAALVGIRIWKKKWPSEAMRRCAILLTGAIIALNQAVITGIDSLFASYYPHLTRILLFVTVMVVVIDLARWKKLNRALLLTTATVWLVAFGASVIMFTNESRAEAMKYAQSDIPNVLDWLQSQSGTLVIAAPEGISGRVPYATRHYDLFNLYGWNLPLTDTELAERYALQVSLIPSSKFLDRTYTPVFGGFAGLSGSKQRTFCQMKNTLFHTDVDCTLDPRSLIRHQELLPMVDNALIDVADAVKKYHVSFIVTEGVNGLPHALDPICSKKTTIGRYSVWGCK